MYDIIRTNYAWVSVDGFLEFCKNLAQKIENWDSFAKTDLENLYKTKTAYHKVRSNLNFATSLTLMNKINGYYKIDKNDLSILNFFLALKEDNIQESLYHLSKVINRLPFFQDIINNFFYDKKVKSTKELKEFLRGLDKNSSKSNYYRQGSRFFSKLLNKLKIIDYNQRSQIIALKGHYPKIKGVTMQKKLTEEESKQGDIVNYILNEISLYFRTKDSNEELAKLIDFLPSEIRIKINSKLLTIARRT